MSRPCPTHFLCFPLVGQSVASELGASLSHFWERASALQTGLPRAAVRPLGTLHLTLGVMELSDKKCLERAIAFLNNLDLRRLLGRIQPQQCSFESVEIMKIQKEVVLGDTAGKGPTCATAEVEEHQNQRQINNEQKNSPHEQYEVLNPLIISLVSLRALPSANKARILYAEPLDSTSRLYPFAQAIQEQFIQAGLIKQDMMYVSAGVGRPQSVPRPLLLHATVANTIYAPKKWSKPMAVESNNGRGRRCFKPKKETQTIDATPLLAEFAGPNDEPGMTPYTWAKGLVIDRLCICEMGAKSIIDEPFTPFGGPILGSEYKIVAERRLPLPHNWGSTEKETVA
ncbi:hypothetical protein KEM54_004854 [Ascosphaera aggregata]|nr:hypothetical protein KEM54_004854 [Ascosphaera aggregata]